LLEYTLLALRRLLDGQDLASLVGAFLASGALLGALDVDAGAFDLVEVGGLIALGLSEMAAKEGGLR
jgi:hypothetical protein